MTDRIFGSMGDIKEGKYVIIDDHPCRIVSMSKAKPGKHGAAKISAVGMSLFDNTKHSLMKPSDSDIEIPIVERKRAQIVSVTGESAQLMDLQSFETFEVTVPEDLRAQMEAGKEMQYIDVMGKRILERVLGGE
jgi:translation initiation factor 5A